MKYFLLSLLLSVGALAQSITIPSQTVVTPVTINGTTIQLSIVIPAQTVAIPAGSGLPTGLTWSNGVFTVAGNISATQVSMTGGPALPTCTSSLFLWQLVAGVLQPSCYVAPTFSIPPITVSQSAINTLTFLP